MGCGISIFEYHSQPNAKATGFGFGNLDKQKIGTNNNTACSSTNKEELIIGGGVFSRKKPPPPPKKDLFLGFTRKFILQHGCSTGHEKRLVKVKGEGEGVPSKKSSNNEYLISSLSHKKEEDDGRELDIVVEIKGVKAITTEDDDVIIIRNADADCDHDRNNNTNTTTTNCIIMDDEDQPRNIPDYDDNGDGPPYGLHLPALESIASPIPIWMKLIASSPVTVTLSLQSKCQRTTRICVTSAKHPEVEGPRKQDQHFGRCLRSTGPSPSPTPFLLKTVE
ncbi:hypothetical protein ACH5RR_010916 [Cinchona calisaya]|uniref:Uncharacterized protein n=1 Tax=Cinchona calisaya TaxID=153742 RepID=A0ABD3A6V4_9GENT